MTIPLKNAKMGSHLVENLEYKIAELLGSFPLLKPRIRKIYIAFWYFLSRKRGFRIELDNSCKLINYKFSNQQKDNYSFYYGYYFPSPWSSETESIILNKLDTITGINEIQLYNKERFVSIGKSSAWNYQQGSLAQWIKRGGEEHIIFNDYYSGKLISTIKDTKGELVKRLSFPIQACYDYDKIASINFRRLDFLRPDYGYNQPSQNFPDNLTYEEDGIWLGSAESDSFNLELTIDQLIKYHPRAEMKGSKHKVNHVMFSPDGLKFLFFHRWISRISGKFSRLFVYSIADKSLKLLLDEKTISHFCWKDNNNIVVYTKSKSRIDYFQINIISGFIESFANGKLSKYGDGHPTFSPNGRFMLTDSYPNKARIANLLLYDAFLDNVHVLGWFLSPIKYEGIKRCDLHPRWSPNGYLVSFDSTHDGRRKTYILDISGLIDIL